MEEPTLKVQGSGELPVSQVHLDDLEWYATKCKSVRLQEIARTELARRKGGVAAPKPAATPATTAIVPAADVQIMTGSFRDTTRATTALQQAMSAGHLVAPAPVCGSLPEGCALALAAVYVDVGTETYEISGKRGLSKRGLSKVALDKIAGAAGVSWDPMMSRRLDDGSDPRYCHYKAVGRVRDFDGTVRTVQGEVEMDARDGSPLIDAIITKAKKRQRDPKDQILELRTFLLRHAESKAKNRAIRSLGVRTSYEERELAKPFLVAKVQFTGETSDPEIRKMFAEKTAESFLGASASLYGGRPLELPPAAAPASDGTHAPPPVGSVGATESDIEAEGEDLPPARASVTEKVAGIPADQDRGPNPNAY